MPIDSQWVGAILRQTRELAGVTREGMATACGVSPGSVSHWESGRVLPNAAQMGTWARVTGVPVDVLYRESGLMESPEALAETPANVTSIRDWWRIRRAAQGGHFRARDKWHKQAAAGGMSGNQGDDAGHTSYLVQQTA